MRPLCANRWNPWICFLTWQKGLCRRDQGPGDGRSIQDYPGVPRVLTAGLREGGRPEGGDEGVEAEARVILGHESKKAGPLEAGKGRTWILPGAGCGNTVAAGTPRLPSHFLNLIFF